MRSAFVLIIIFAVASCTIRPGTPADKKKKTPVQKQLSRDQVLKGYQKKKISRKGTYSTVTDGFVTTDTYRREDGESVFIYEKGDLRVETESRKSGFVLTRTWQDGILTSMMVTGKRRTTLLYFDRDGEFLNKIVTIRDKETPDCYHYQNGKAVELDDASCLSLIPDFD